MNLYDLELDLNKKVANCSNLFTNVDTYRGFFVHCVNDVDTLELYLQQKNNFYKVTGIKENNNFSFIFPLLKKGYVKFQFVGKKENEIIGSNFFYSIVKDNIISEVTNSRNVNLIQLFDKISNNEELSGEKGDKGDTGEQGIQGLAGLKGDKGDIGEQGTQGLPGLKGDKGDIGEQGTQGLPGLKGDKGDTGEQGIQGLPGEYKFGKWIREIRSTGSIGFTALGTTVSNIQSTLSAQAPSNVFSRMTIQSTAGSASATTSLSFNPNDIMRGVTGQPGGFNIWVRFGLPDTSYDGTGTGTGSGIIAGIYSGATMAIEATGIGTMHCACFRRIHNFGVLTHANWQFVTNNATSSVGTEIDTGLPFIAGNMYLINISCVNEATGITWYIKNENTGQSATGLATGTLPAVNTMLGLYIMSKTINAVARKIGTQFLYCESDR